MDNILTQNIIITTISIVLSAFFSWFFTRRSIRRHRIVHFMINSFDIGKGLSDEFPNFKLINDGVELSNNVMILKGGFINVSTKDIGDTDKKIDFQIELPKGCDVKDIKIKTMVKGLTVQSQILEAENKDRNIILFCIDGVFKANEHFEYTVIVELPSELDDLNYKQFKFSHRITNTEIENIYLGPEKSPKVSFFSNGITLVVKDFNASIFSLIASIIIDILIILFILRTNIFDLLSIIILATCFFAIISDLIAFIRIMLIVKDNNHILKTIHKDTDA